MSTIDPGQLILRLSIAMMVAYLLVGAPYIAIARYGAKHPNPNWGLIKTLSTITLAFGMGAMAVVIGSLWGPWWLTLLVAAYTAALGGAVGFAMSVPTIKKARATREQYEKLGVRRPSVKLWDVFRLPPTVRGHARGVWKLGAAYGYLAVFLVLEYQFPSLGISSGQGMGYWVLPLLLWSALSAIVGWRGMIVAYPSPATDQWHVVWAIHGLSLFPSSLGVIIALTLNAITEAQFLNALSAVLLPLGHFFVASRWRAS